MPPSADDSSTSKKRASKKWPCPAGQVQKPRKRPTKEDSVPLFAKYVEEAIRAKEIRKKRPASPTMDNSEEPSPRRKRTRQGDGQDGGSDMPMSEKSSGSSFDSAGGGQQGTRTRDRSSVADEVDKYYEFIMDDKGETRPGYTYSRLKNCIVLEEKKSKNSSKRNRKSVGISL